MKNEFSLRFSLYTIAISLCACNGPRFIHSVSPLLSPVPLEKGATSVAADYFTHNKVSGNFDSIANHDNAFALSAARMHTENLMLSATIDFKKEQNIFSLLADSFYRYTYNGGFDSSIVRTKRYTAGFGATYFFNSLEEETRFIFSVGGSFNLHYMQLSESGQLKNNPYHRYFNEYQAGFSFQNNLLLKVSKRINLAYIARLSIVQFFKPKTDFTEDEQFSTGLSQGKKTLLFPSFISGYAGYKPIKDLPLYLEMQVFNDVALWDHFMADYDGNRPNIKGSGIALGLKYVFQ